MNKAHEVESFDCGSAPLNAFLKRFALQSQGSDAARTFVATQDGRVVGYYSLCAASVGYEETPERIRKGLAKHPIPMILLARLAVDRSCQGEGLGSGLLLDAFGRFLTAQPSIAAWGLLAHAKDDSAKAFYERWGFSASDGFPYHLYLLTKDIRATYQTVLGISPNLA